MFQREARLSNDANNCLADVCSLEEGEPPGFPDRSLETEGAGPAHDPCLLQEILLATGNAGLNNRILKYSLVS